MNRDEPGRAPLAPPPSPRAEYATRPLPTEATADGAVHLEVRVMMRRRRVEPVRPGRAIGAEDHETSPARQDLLRRSFGAGYVALDGADHGLHVAEADVINARIAFLGELPWEPARRSAPRRRGWGARSFAPGRRRRRGRRGHRAARALGAETSR